MAANSGNGKLGSAAEYVSRGNVYEEMGDNDKAIADFTSAIQADPSYDDAYRRRGCVYRRLGVFDKAIADFTSAIRISVDRNDPDDPIDAVYYLRGCAYAGMGDQDKAIADFTSAIQINPNHRLSYIERGILYADKGDFGKTIADFTEAIRIDPNGGNAYILRGSVYSIMGNHDNAIADYTMVERLGMNPGASFYFDCGVSHSKLGHVKKAIRNYEKYLELTNGFDPDDEEIAAKVASARKALKELRVGNPPEKTGGAPKNVPRGATSPQPPVQDKTGHLKCRAHPTQNGVATCKKCNRTLCKKCADRCVKSDEKYFDLCDDCVLKVGIDCGNHPSRRAEARCDKCGKFICGDCFDSAWDGLGGVSDEAGRYCHACVSEAVSGKVEDELGHVKRAAKAGMIWVGVLSALGLLIGLAIGLDKDSAFGYAWMGAGIGCGVRVLFSLPGIIFGRYFSKRDRSLGVAFLTTILTWVLIGSVGCLGFSVLGALFFLIGALTGPIIPIIYMLIRKSQLKKVGAMIERYDDLCETMRNAHAKPGDSAAQAEIHQGAATFAADMTVVENIKKPILRILR